MSGGEMRVQALEARVLLASIAPDASFGDGGDVRVPMRVSHDDAAFVGRVQANGKVLVAGVTTIQHTRRLLLTRLNANGSLDKRFGRGGMAVHELDLDPTRDWFEVGDAAVQPDGKIVVAGHVDSMFSLARFNSDGSRDDSFGDGGIFTPDVGPGGETLGVALRVLVLPDGGILGVGRMDVNADEINYDIGIVRLRADGSPDGTFGGGDGVVTTDLFEMDTAHDVALDRLGRLVVVGASVNEADDGFAEGDVHHGVVLRYERDGQRDTSFAFSGTAWAMQEDSFAYLQRVLVHGKKIITGGDTSEGSVVFRLNERGRWLHWDSPLGRKGTLQWDSRDGVSAILPRGKGGFTVVTTDNGIPDDNEPDRERNLHVIHLNADGSRDKSAGRERHVKTVYGDAHHNVATHAARAGDGYVVVGRTREGTEQDFTVLRLREDGRPEKSFGRNGRVTLDHRDKAPLRPDGLLVLRSGKVLAWGGYFELSERRYFVRLNPDGSLDESFGRGGMSQFTFPDPYTSTDLLVSEATNGDIVIAAQAADSDTAIMRVRADGSPGKIIGNGGVVRDDGIAYPSLLHVTDDDTMLLGGHFEGPAYQDVPYVLHWFESDGKRMPNSARLHFDAFQRFHVALPQEDGGVLVLGIVSEATEMVSPMEPTRPVNGRLTMLRYHAGASRDESFGDKGLHVVSSVEIDRILGVRQLPGGDLVVAGLDTIPDSGGGFDGDVVMMRLSADGTLEGSWASDAEGRVGRAQLQPDGDLLLLNEDETLLVRANGEVGDAFDAGPISFEAATMDADGDLIVARPYRRGLLIRKFDVDA